MGNPVQELQRLGQSVWLDFINREMLTSGRLRELIDLGVTGVTSNPSIFEKALVDTADYDDDLTALIRQGADVQEMYESLAIADIRSAADVLRPVFEETGGRDGFVSLEVSPYLARDTEATVEEARRLRQAVDRPNLLIKIPATPEGIPAIRQAVGEGVNVNVTLIFSIAVYRQVMDAYLAGLEAFVAGGGDPSKVASVASFFVSRVDTLTDKLLEYKIEQGREGLRPLLGKAAVANAKLAYQAYREVFSGERFAALKARGANVQRPLWGSTSAKNPAYSDLLYVEGLVGPDTVNTMPPATLDALLDHGAPRPTLEEDVDAARRTLADLAEAGIDLEKVTDRLLADGVKAFSDSFRNLLSNLRVKRDMLSAQAV